MELNGIVLPVEIEGGDTHAGASVRRPDWQAAPGV